MSKRILIVLTSHDQLGDTEKKPAFGWKSWPPLTMSSKTRGPR